MVTPVAAPKRNTSVVMGASDSHPSGSVSKSMDGELFGSPVQRVQYPLSLGSGTPPGSSLPPDAANVTSCHCTPRQNTSGSWKTAVMTRRSRNGLSSSSGSQLVHTALVTMLRE